MSGIVGGINLRSSGLVNNSSASDGQVLTGTGAGLPAGFEAAAAGGGGKILQVVSVVDVTTGSGTNVIPSDDTIPQLSELNIFATLDIEPASTSNKLLITSNISCVFGAAIGYAAICLFNDDTHATNALATSWMTRTINYREQMYIQHYMEAGFAIPITFKVGVADVGSGTVHKNAHTTGARIYGGTMSCVMTIFEIDAS